MGLFKVKVKIISLSLSLNHPGLKLCLPNHLKEIPHCSSLNFLSLSLLSVCISQSLYLFYFSACLSLSLSFSHFSSNPKHLSHVSAFLLSFVDCFPLFHLSSFTSITVSIYFSHPHYPLRSLFLSPDISPFLPPYFIFFLSLWTFFLFSASPLFKISLAYVNHSL